MIDNAEERADILNAIQKSISEIGYTIAGYDDNNDVFFQVLIMRDELNMRREDER